MLTIKDYVLAWLRFQQGCKKRASVIALTSHWITVLKLESLLHAVIHGWLTFTRWRSNQGTTVQFASATGERATKRLQAACMLSSWRNVVAASNSSKIMSLEKFCKAS